MDRAPRHSPALKLIAATCVLGLLALTALAALNLLTHPLIGLCS